MTYLLEMYWVVNLLDLLDITYFILELMSALRSTDRCDRFNLDFDRSGLEIDLHNRFLTLEPGVSALLLSFSEA